MIDPFYRTKDQFSKFFEDRDWAEVIKYDESLLHHPLYTKINNKWKNALEKKRRRQQRIKEIKASTIPKEPDVEKFVVHDPINGVDIPSPDNGIFAVIQVQNRQFKIMKDDTLILDGLKGYDINDPILFDQVLMVGTKTYTSIGRPLVLSAKVYGTIEENDMSRKTTVFRYKRRKNYQKHHGASYPLTIVRIDKIVHSIDEQLTRAVPLL